MMVALLVAHAATRQAAVAKAADRPTTPKLALVRSPRPASSPTSNRETAS